MAFAVFCIVPSLTQTNAIVGQLEASGLGGAHVSILLPDWRNHEGELGGATGRMHLRPVKVAGVGPLIATGYVADALSARAPTTLAGALVGLGLHEPSAKLYEERVRDGNVFLAARADDAAGRDHAKSVFHMAGAYDINVGTSPSEDR